MIVLALLLFLPLAFVLGTSDPFEPTKAALLLTGAAALAGVGLDRALGAFFSAGPALRLRRAWTVVVDTCRREPLTGAMIACLAASALAAILSDRPLASLFGDPSRPAGLLVAAAMTALYLAARAAAASPAWFDRAAAAASAAAGLAALYGLAQWAGLDPIAWEGAATIDGKLRVPSTLGHPNLLGAYLAMTIPLAGYLAWRARTLAPRVAWGTVAGASLAVLAATLSRGAWLAAAAAALTGGALLAASRRPSAAPRGGVRAGRVALATLAALLLFTLPLWTPLGEGFRTRLGQIADLRAPTSHARLLLWEAGARMAAEHPLAGVGTDAFGAHVPRYRTPAFWEVEWAGAPVKAHSEIVQIAATQGAIGLAAALAAILFAGGALLRLARGGSDRAASGGATRGEGLDEPGLTGARAAAAGALLAAWAVSSATNFSVAATGSLAAVMAGWIAGRARESVREPGARAERPEPPRFDALRAAVGVLAATLLWIPLVATPWRAEFAASRARVLPIADPERAELQRRAALLAPWQDRYAAELGRTHLVFGFEARSPRDAWRHLGWARGAYERAVAAGPEVAEHRAFLARVVAGQSALARSPSAARRAADALSEAYGADSTSANVLVLLAEGYAAAGSPADAYRVALRCARLYPDYAVPMADLGIFALEAGRASGAADTLALALRRSWRDAPGMEPMARAWLDRAIERRASGEGR